MTSADADAERLDFDLALTRALYQSPVAVATFDREFRYVALNDTLVSVRGPREEALGRHLSDVAPEVWASIEPHLRRALAGETITGVNLSEGPHAKLAYRRYWLSNFFPVKRDDEVVGVGVVSIDVTALRNTERALRLRTDLFELLAPVNRVATESTSTDDLYRRICDLATTEGRFLYAFVMTTRGERLHILAISSLEPSVVEQVIERVHDAPFDRSSPSTQGASVRTLLTGESTVVNDFTYSPVTMPWHQLGLDVGIGSVAAFPIHDGTETVAVLSLVSRERNFFDEEMLEALKEMTPVISFAVERFSQEARRRRDQMALELRDRAIDASSQGILVTDARTPGHPVLYAGPSFERLTQYTTDDIVGRGPSMLRGPDTDPRAAGLLDRAVNEGRPCSVELLEYRKDGTSFWANVMITPIFDDDNVLTNFVEVITDVTERRELEQQLLQAQKMEAIGVLAAGIAHDFNNMLLVIRGYSDLFAKRVQDDELRAMAYRIDDAVQQAAAVTQRLLAFSRQQVLRPEPLSLNELLRDTMWLWRRMLRDTISLNLDLAPSIEEVVVDRGQIEQVVVNLVTNACDAMPEGGTLTIRTSAVTYDETRAERAEGVEPGRYVRVEIADTGIGIGEEHQRRVFEPFYTTKPHGTGLGLATVYGIVKQCGGHIDLRSRSGEGTTFTLDFPAAIAAPSRRPQRKMASFGLEGSETVLVVEDLDEARTLLADSLRSLGYRVLEAANGVDALEVAAAHPETIDLVVTDIAMPKMDGRELAGRLRERRPDIKIVFTSGYPSSTLTLDAAFASNAAFLEKPYLLDQIARLIRELLG